MNVVYKKNLQTGRLNTIYPHEVLSALLCDLQTSIPGLPRDARTVLRTVKKVDTKTVAGGEYYYFGVHYWLSKLFESPPSSDVDELHLQVNIDGIPLFNSCTTSVWPIFGFVKEFTKAGNVGHNPPRTLSPGHNPPWFTRGHISP